jgi:hypothetical protein
LDERVAHTQAGRCSYPGPPSSRSRRSDWATPARLAIRARKKFDRRCGPVPSNAFEALAAASTNPPTRSSNFGSLRSANHTRESANSSFRILSDASLLTSLDVTSPTFANCQKRLLIPISELFQADSFSDFRQTIDKRRWQRGPAEVSAIHAPPHVVTHVGIVNVALRPWKRLLALRDNYSKTRDCADVGGCL